MAKKTNLSIRMKKNLQGVEEILRRPAIVGLNSWIWDPKWWCHPQSPTKRKVSGHKEGWISAPVTKLNLLCGCTSNIQPTNLSQWRSWRTGKQFEWMHSEGREWMHSELNPSLDVPGPTNLTTKSTRSVGSCLTSPDIRATLVRPRSAGCCLTSTNLTKFKSHCSTDRVANWYSSSFRGILKFLPMGFQLKQQVPKATGGNVQPATKDEALSFANCKYQRGAMDRKLWWFRRWRWWWMHCLQAFKVLPPFGKDNPNAS